MFFQPRYYHYDPGEIFLWLITIPLVLLLTFGVLPFWCICKKAGYPPWYSLAILLPPFNIAFLFFMAFSEWPVLRRLDVLSGRRLQALGPEPAKSAGQFEAGDGIRVTPPRA